MIPQSLESERLFLGGLIIDKDNQDYIDKVNIDLFYLQRHQIIFRAIEELYKDKNPIDTISIAQMLNKKLSEVGGKSYLSELTDDLYAAMNIDYHYEVIFEKWQLRELLRLGNQISNMAIQDKPEGIIQHTEKNIDNLIMSLPSSYESLKKVLERVEPEIAEIQKNGQPNLPSFGISELDRILIGWANEFYLLMADSRMGKSAFALFLAVLRAVEVPVYYAAAEMSSEQLALRVLAMKSEINGMKFKSGFMSNEDLHRLQTEIIPQLNNLNLFFNDSPRITIRDIKSDCKKLSKEHGNIGLIVIDYLQILGRHDKFENTREFLEDIAKECKALSKEFQCPVLGISSVTKKCEYESRPPTLHDAKGSADLGFGSDVSIGFYRPFIYGKSTDKQETRIGILKSRNTQTGKFELRFELEYQRFTEVKENENW